MGILKDKLSQPEMRPRLIADCVTLVDQEVASKSGVTGFMIKGGYKAFTTIMPRMVENAVDVLLDEFLVVLDRHYDTYSKAVPDKKTPFESWAKARDVTIAEDLLKITDEIMNRSSKTAIKKIYSGMRKVAQRNVADAVPGIGRLVTKNLA
jgi:hypothetical protein